MILMNKIGLYLLSWVLILAFNGCTSRKTCDVCVYGGNSSAVMAAYSAAQMGKTVVVISPEMRLGGLTTGGLGYTDIGNKQAVIGLAKDFYRKLGMHYGKLEQWIFEPSVALTIMEQYLDHPNIVVHRGYLLSSVDKKNTEIKSITVSGSANEMLQVRARNFIDASYEGDLMAMSGVSYAVGRESSETYGESWNGVHLLTKHQFPDGIDPYKVPGKPESGLLWGVSDQKLLPEGSGDRLLQAYNYRICLTDSLENQIPITEPENYNPERYALLLRLIEAQPDKRTLNDYFIWSMLPGRKTDINNRGAFSTDMIGMNYNYAEGSYQERQNIIKDHTDYTKGLLYFLGHDSRVPQQMREQMLCWGYPKDEYLETDHWTPQLYVREVRRMVGEYVVTQKDCEGKTVVTDGIAYAAYGMDSHNCQRIVVNKDGMDMVKNEGDVEIRVPGPYPISYRSITPKKEECTNLLVTACLSSSHIAFGSIRMEPVFMALGQAAGIAASLATEGVQNLGAAPVQDVMMGNPFMDGSEPDILIDDSSDSFKYSDGWSRLSRRGGFGPTFLQLNGNLKSETVEVALPSHLSGEWAVYSYQQKADINTPLTYFDVIIGDKTFKRSFDIKGWTVSGQTRGDWYHLGDFTFSHGTEAKINIYAEDDNLPIIADALLLIKK